MNKTLKFKIPKGGHYSKIIPMPFKDGQFGIYKCRIEFDSIQPDQDYYSKLVGVCHLIPRVWSERIGWRFLDNRIDIAFYSERWWKPKYKSIGSYQISVNRYGKRSLELYIFISPWRLSVGRTLANMWDNTILFERPWFKLFWGKPFHGGDPTAAQDYYITFDKEESYFEPNKEPF